MLKIRELSAKMDHNYLIKTNQELNENRINFLVLGGRAEDLLSDLILIYSYYLPDHSSNTLTIPRDLGAPEVYRATSMPGSARINQAYGLGGMKFVKTIAENATGLSMDLALWIDLKAFANIIGTVDSIEINLKHDIKDEYYGDVDGVGYEPFFMKAGDYEVDGSLAVKLARSRQGENNDDYARGERMRDITSAFLKKALTEGKKDFSYLGKLRGVLEQEIKAGRIKPDFDLGIIFPAMLGPVPIGLTTDLPSLLWTQQFGEGWTFGNIPIEYSTGLTRENLIESAKIPGVSIDKIKGHNYLTQKPLDYWGPSREFTENFLRRTGRTVYIQR